MRAGGGWFHRALIRAAIPTVADLGLLMLAASAAAAGDVYAKSDESAQPYYT